MIRLVIIVGALMALLVPSAWAFNPYEGLQPADSYLRLGPALRVARATWPNSPCRGQEQVAFVNPDLPNGKLTYQGQTGDAFAFMDGSCRVFISNEPMSDYITCVVLTHEFGHLDGQLHSTNPSDIMYPVTPSHFKPCEDAQYD